ncbi:hypothetical protein KL919_000662 [Ogataea angusta]|nr:hypothetical protein KL909_000603 [Ogataea angusta]KAG7831703.1 hypothetical protein KL920_000038 [Ogataea angusta]KAG7835876.1 hypothetical protein KL943_001525 [Ogataea angusta]KAG7863347.1 hypothetical protein KL919_000662 [Ogataea angusta]
MARYWCKTCSKASAGHRAAINRLVRGFREKQQELEKLTRQAEKELIRAREKSPIRQQSLPVAQPVNEHHYESERPAYSVPTGVRERKITKSEKELREWGLNEKPIDEELSSDSDTERKEPKPKPTFKKRIPKNQHS